MCKAHRGSPQTVKKVRNRQNRFTIQWAFALWTSFTKVWNYQLYSLKTSLLRKNFDLLRNSRPAVPMYADERELLVFRTFSQSVSVPKRVFRHAESPQAKACGLQIIISAFSDFYGYTARRGSLRRSGRRPYSRRSSHKCARTCRIPRPFARRCRARPARQACA